jgi:hypothetical protein
VWLPVWDEELDEVWVEVAAWDDVGVELEVELDVDAAVEVGECEDPPCQPLPLDEPTEVFGSGLARWMEGSEDRTMCGTGTKKTGYIAIPRGRSSLSVFFFEVVLLGALGVLGAGDALRISGWLAA